MYKHANTQLYLDKNTNKNVPEIHVNELHCLKKMINSTALFHYRKCIKALQAFKSQLSTIRLLAAKRQLQKDT